MEKRSLQELNILIPIKPKGPLSASKRLLSHVFPHGRKEVKFRPLRTLLPDLFLRDLHTTSSGKLKHAPQAP